MGLFMGPLPDLGILFYFDQKGAFGRDTATSRNASDTVGRHHGADHWLAFFKVDFKNGLEMDQRGWAVELVLSPLVFCAGSKRNRLRSDRDFQLPDPLEYDLGGLGVFWGTNEP